MAREEKTPELVSPQGFRRYRRIVTVIGTALSRQKGGCLTTVPFLDLAVLPVNRIFGLVFLRFTNESLLASRNRYHSTHVTRPELGGRLPRAIKPNRGDVGSGNVSKTAERAVFLAVDVDGWIWLGLVFVETRLSPVAQEVRPKSLDYLVRGGRSRAFDLLLGDQLRLADVSWTESRGSTREENSAQRRHEKTRVDH